jgi:hypothetical protein
MSSRQYIDRKISRLNREIAKIDAAFYAFEEQRDRDLHASMLERKRDDLVRAAVLQLHTATEDLLNVYIMRTVLQGKKGRSHAAKALQRMVYGAGSLGFDMKLNVAVALGLIKPSLREQLMELNTIRNKCSHNWLLNVRVRRGKRPRQ